MSNNSAREKTNHSRDVDLNNTKNKKTTPISVERHFSSETTSPFDQIEWEKRTVTITDEKGAIVFEQKDVEVPKFFSQLAAKVVVSKYFYGEKNTGERESSFKELVHRVARTIADWGLQDGLFADQKQADLFYNELAWLCVNQYGAFNSPVWFNVGLFDVKGIPGSAHNYYWDTETQSVKPCPNSYQYPQSSACFIQQVGDTMEDIMALATSEAMLFKHGSGTGTDLSTLRSSREKLSGGGRPSGPLSFMRVFDQIAAVVKSGGKTRRAAKMQSLKIHHPDIKEFITCKADEERKAWALIEEGYDGNFNGEAYSSVMFQNANLSVRVDDEFMAKAKSGGTIETRAVTTGDVIDHYDAQELMHLIAEGTHICGDPGLQYDTTINRWHTCPNSGPINASNPCSEYMFIDSSACNLASLNLMKFRQSDGSFNVEAFRKAIRIFIIAQELIVDHGSYPTELITENSHKFRPLGLGYANLGALLMSLGLPYDSAAGRSRGAAITAVMTGTAYAVSAELAQCLGTFDEYDKNREPMLKVIGMHRNAVRDIDQDLCPANLYKAAQNSWDQALAQGESNGFRNAQVSVLAPTGTIGFMMDCDTTGVEPDIALVKYKLLAGGGMLKIVNNTVQLALQQLGYNPEQIKNIIAWIDENDTIEGADDIDDQHLPVFDCAFKATKGQRFIHYLAHIRMMAAVQPFISGAISKTINMPTDCTIEDIAQAYITGWELGVKAVAIYRDGSKRSQPVNTNKAKLAAAERKGETLTLEQVEERLENLIEYQPVTNDIRQRRAQRVRLPATRHSITHKFDVAGHEGYLTVGLYEDGQPGELFITMAKEGSTVGGLMDAFGTCVSMALQYGVPLSTLVDKFSHMRFEPAGMTGNRDIPFAKSLIDYISRWLGMTFLPGYRQANAPKRPSESNDNDNDEDTTVNPSSSIPGDRPALLGQRTDLNNIANRIDQLIGMVNKPGGEPITLGDSATQMQAFNQQFGHFQEDAPVCDVCGSITVRNGNCYRCHNCGASMGCS
ncbi:MAG: vitamin B12-dependent ribonucleotide reductase [Sedimentisphaerales bacterium]|nr:vitamin B12-dependent ribonucleotide reductase [Sedimentisphaerales bacterium]